VASDVEICNLAMIRLGAETITSLSQNSANARRCAAVFELARDAELRKHVWNFAREKARLAADTTPPPFGYGYQYPLPTDFLRLHPDVEAADWQIEGGYILTDDGAPLDVTYIKRITDTSLFDAIFDDALAWRIATDLAEEITQSNTKKAAAQEGYRDTIREAKRVNAVERVSDEPPADTWIATRL